MHSGQYEEGKYALYHSNLAAVQHFSKDFEPDTLKESTIMGWES